MRKQIVALLLLALVSTVSLASAIEIQKDAKYEPGFVEWELAQEEHLFVEGLNVGEAVLQRARPDAAVVVLLPKSPMDRSLFSILIANQYKALLTVISPCKFIFQ